MGQHALSRSATQKNQNNSTKSTNVCPVAVSEEMLFSRVSVAIGFVRAAAVLTSCFSLNGGKEMQLSQNQWP